MKKLIFLSLFLPALLAAQIPSKETLEEGKKKLEDAQERLQEFGPEGPTSLDPISREKAEEHWQEVKEEAEEHFKPVEERSQEYWEKVIEDSESAQTERGI